MIGNTGTRDSFGGRTDVYEVPGTGIGIISYSPNCRVPVLRSLVSNTGTPDIVVESVPVSEYITVRVADLATHGVPG